MTTKHVVGFSGGIDSQACAGWVLDRFPKEDVILLNSDAGGNEHPLTTEHIRWYSANVHPVIEVHAIVSDLGVGREGSKRTELRKDYPDETVMTFDLMAKLNGRFPSRRAQFCTEYLKMSPLRRWMRENIYDHGNDVIRYAGVRREESKSRESTPDSKWDKYNDCEVHFPIASWTKQQCFEFVKQRGEIFNPLYTFGFSRVGCSPCVNSGKEDVNQWATRFPEMIEKIREWEAFVGKSFFPPNIVPGKNIAWVDEVVAWSKTTRGGKQIALPFAEAEAANGSCSSKYGLCE